jgi:hypothetical protein
MGRLQASCGSPVGRKAVAVPCAGTSVGQALETAGRRCTLERPLRSAGRTRRDAVQICE